MSRARSGIVSKKRHKKVLNLAKGYVGSKSKLFRVANEQLLHSLSYAYRDRRNKKRDFRKLWIIRLNAAARAQNLTYSKLIFALNKSKIEINRKILAIIAWKQPETFSLILKKLDITTKKIDITIKN